MRQSVQELMERYQNNLFAASGLYYKDQKLDITNRFKDGICYVKLTDGKDIMYLTVKYKNGYAMSDSRYLSPREFN